MGGSRVSSDTPPCRALNVAPCLVSHLLLENPSTHPRVVAGQKPRLELTKKQRQELRECFNLIDTDGSGSISQAEITEALSYMGVHVTAKSLAKIMKDVDTDGSGELEYSEFSQVRRRRSAAAVPQAKCVSVCGLGCVASQRYVIRRYPFRAASYSTRKSTTPSTVP